MYLSVCDTVSPTFIHFFEDYFLLFEIVLNIYAEYVRLGCGSVWNALGIFSLISSIANERVIRTIRVEPPVETQRVNQLISAINQFQAVVF